VILMRVIAAVSENQIWRDSCLQILENVLHFGAREGHETIAKLLQHDPLETLDQRTIQLHTALHLSGPQWR